MSRPREIERYKVGGLLLRRMRHQDGRETLRVDGKTLTPEQASQTANLLTAMVLRTAAKPRREGP